MCKAIALVLLLSVLGFGQNNNSIILYNFTFGIIQYGHILECQFANGLSLSFQNITYEEFQGLAPKVELQPNRELKANFLKIGYGKWIKNFKVGLNAGVGYGTGIFRGAFLRKERPACGESALACSWSDLIEYYEPNKFKDILWTANFKLEYRVKYFGGGIAPQMFFQNSTYITLISLFISLYL